MDPFYSAPPVIRTLIAGTVIISVTVHAGFLRGNLFGFYRDYLFKIPPEPWRLITPFMLSGGGLDLLFTPYLMWTYGGRLEKKCHRLNKPGDFFVYMLFVCSVILGVNALYFQRAILTDTLVLAFAWTYSQDVRGRNAEFYVITIPVQWLPWAILLMTLVSAGPDAALAQATGILAAHLFDFLTRLWPQFGGGKNYLETPFYLRRLFAGAAARPAAEVSDGNLRSTGSSATSGSTSGASPAARQAADAWRNRGAGHRLG